MKKWRAQGLLHSAALLVSADSEFVLSDQAGTKHIWIGKPSEVAGQRWTSWDNRYLPTWAYPVTVLMEVPDATEPERLAWSKLESVASRLSFVTSAPVIVASYGSVTDAPETPVSGESYRTVILSFDTVTGTQADPPVFPEALARALANVLIPDSLRDQGGERIERSLTWLQQSHVALTPVHEFMSLMLAFEALSHLLAPAPSRCWKCATCGLETVGCPSCGASTESAGPASHSLRRFVREYLSWSEVEWKAVWRYRNVVFHGAQDLAWEQQQAIVRVLPRLEVAVINAIRFLSGFPEGAPPVEPRIRGLAYGATLDINWSPPPSVIADSTTSPPAEPSDAA